MNTRTIVTVMAAALFSVSLVPVSSAQERIRAVPEGIEVITITGKRPEVTVATACADRLAARRDAIGERRDGAGDSSAEVEFNRSDMGNTHRASKPCGEQTAPFAAQI